jgi:hypothetical protein
MVPDLPPVTGPTDTAERLLLLLHYSIDWDTSWVAQHRKTYWDEKLPSRVRTAARRADNDLDRWWSRAAGSLGARAPRQQDRRLELATLLREPPEPVIDVLRDKLPSLLLRVHIIAETVADNRNKTRP